MRFACDAAQCQNYDVASRKEWILTNATGGYSMGTVAGTNSRRYHGLLVAATEPWQRRVVLLSNVEAFAQTDGQSIGLSCNQYLGAVYPEGYQLLRGFKLSAREAQWTFRAGGMDVRKSVLGHEGENGVTIRYTNTGSRPLTLVLLPLVCHKPYHGNFRFDERYPHAVAMLEGAVRIEHEGLPLYLIHPKAERSHSLGWYYRFHHLREEERGLDPRDDLYCPCELNYRLEPDESCDLIASTSSEAEAQEAHESPVEPTLGAALREAAGLFLVQHSGRSGIVAGFPWFTDWGRDTMISLPGICLCTGKTDSARSILRSHASQMRQGLIPNRCVETGEEPEYNTADATLWFAHAIHATLLADWDEAFAAECFEWLTASFEWHMRGTLFGIGVNHEDGLLTQGEDGMQLTWMDAKVGDWVVTPRHGKPVEVNGLWVNALRVCEWLAVRLDKPSDRFAAAAAKAEASFEQKFWRERLGYYLDTADPDDASLRPNQVIAMSLPFGPAKGDCARKALEIVSRELLTPVGLRTLSPQDAAYRGSYQGPLSTLDAAYHQGTVWPWLLGPYVTALVKLTGDRAEAKRILKPAREWLSEYGLGGIAEVYDGDEPRQPGGCPWQAWSVAEILRAWTDDAQGK